jgi:hypothetical protein
MTCRSMVAAVLVAIGVAACAPAAEARTVYRGQWTCNDRGFVQPLPGMAVELWKRGWDWLPVELSGSRIAAGFTDDGGRFSMTSPDDGDIYFVRMALRDSANVHLKDFWGINDWSIDSEGRRNDRPVQDLGGLRLEVGNGRSPKCAIWRGVHLAHVDFRGLMGANPPQGGQEIQADAPTAGTPFTPHTSIWWTSDFNVGRNPGEDTVTRHEFAHAFRHGFDGDLGHFLGDVATHGYARNHGTCDRTGLGFAFNEGWAEYWARDFAPAPACPGIAADDFEVEGNVAAALTELQARCAGGSRRPMVEVLRANPGVIHSFQEFRDRLPCPAPDPAPAPPPPPVESSTVSLSPAARAALTRSRVRAAGGAIAELRVDLRTALRRAADPPACKATPCLGALERRTAPAGLRTEIALAKIARAAAKRADTVKELRRWEKRGDRRAIKLADRIEKRLGKAAARAVATGARRVLKAARPVFRRDKSAETRAFRRTIAAQLARMRKAARTGRPPASLTLDDAVLERITKVPLPPAPPTPTPTPNPTPTPTPSPTPTPDPRETATLSITCSYNANLGRIVAGGTLTPPHPGTTLDVTFSRPPTLQTIQTQIGPKGEWTESLDVANFPGDWTAQATWDGDADTKPATSAPCLVTVP